MELERPPDYQDKESPPLYHASSIEDMLTSRDQVAQNAREPSRFFTSRMLRETPTQKFINILLRKPNTPSSIAVVWLPPVRHFPQEDSDEPDKMTIHDRTGSCVITDIHALTWNSRIIEAFQEEKLEDFALLKSQAWASQLALLNVYPDDRRKPDIFYLLDIYNDQIRVQVPEGIPQKPVPIFQR